jgi:cytochrome c oxidase subunit 3
MNETTPSSSSPAPAASDRVGSFGMWLFLTSLGILFAASIAGYLVVRSRAVEWPPPEMPELPAGLWVSTIVILISSVTIQIAWNGVRKGRQGALIGGMLITCLLAVVFLVTQVANWAWLVSLNATFERASAMAAEAPTGSPLKSAPMYLFTFYLLTGLHALHVIGGLVLLFVVAARSFRGFYSAGRHFGVRFAATYWHFLDAVWLIMFVLMFLV